MSMRAAALKIAGAGDMLIDRGEKYKGGGAGIQLQSPANGFRLTAEMKKNLTTAVKNFGLQENQKEVEARQAPLRRDIERKRKSLLFGNADAGGSARRSTFLTQATNLSDIGLAGSMGKRLLGM